MNRERFREKVVALLRQYYPLVAGTYECAELRWGLNELLDPANDGPGGFINELTVHDGRIVVKVYVPDRAELDADEWCAALQEYTGDALVVEPAGDMANREAMKKLVAGMSAAYVKVFAGGGSLPATAVPAGWTEHTGVSVAGTGMCTGVFPEWVGTTASATALADTGNKALAAAHLEVREKLAKEAVAGVLSEHYAAEAKRNPPHIALTRQRGAKGKPKRW